MDYVKYSNSFVWNTEKPYVWYILIECHDNEKLVQFYLDNDFEVLSRILDEDKKMVQMLRRFEC